MGNTVEQEKDITFSQAFVEEWLKTAPKQVLDHLKTLTEGYERLRKQVGQHEEQIARQAKLLAEQQALTSAALQLSKMREDDVDHLNDDKDEQRITKDPEFIGWNLVGGIRFGKAAVIRTLNGQDFLKVSIAPMTKDFIVDFDIFPLAVKRDGRNLTKVCCGFYKGSRVRVSQVLVGHVHHFARTSSSPNAADMPSKSRNFVTERHEFSKLM